MRMIIGTVVTVLFAAIVIACNAFVLTIVAQWPRKAFKVDHRFSLGFIGFSATTVLVVWTLATGVGFNSLFTALIVWVSVACIVLVLAIGLGAWHTTRESRFVKFAEPKWPA